MQKWCVVFVVIVGLIVSCSNRDGYVKNANGTLALRSITLSTSQPLSEEPDYLTAENEIDCEASSIEKIWIGIFDGTSELKNFTFDCDDHHAKVAGISPGDKRRLVIRGENRLNEVVYEGEKEIAIRAGEVTVVDNVALEQKQGCDVMLYVDGDMDGYGKPDAFLIACEHHDGYSQKNGDCDDAAAAIHPEATEVCDDTIDQNCNSYDSEPGCQKKWYRDSDGDTYGDLENSILAGWPPEGYVANNGDCRDDNPAIFPHAEERCDAIDNQCPGDDGYGKVDENSSCEYVVNRFGLSFMRIPAGTFTMGSPESEPSFILDETQHTVILTQDYYMQDTEVTQKQWYDIVTAAEAEGYLQPGDLSAAPSHFYACGDMCPVENVTWDDVQTFISALNEFGVGRYRLPTEAQWEYAARAGEIRAFANGDLTPVERPYMNCDYDVNLDALGWYCYNADNQTHPVMEKIANDWGLYDMHGNVGEWCLDSTNQAATYPSGPVHDPYQAATAGHPFRIIRGGSWYTYAALCRSASRGFDSPENAREYRGFRLVYLP